MRQQPARELRSVFRDRRREPDATERRRAVDDELDRELRGAAAARRAPLALARGRLGVVAAGAATATLAAAALEHELAPCGGAMREQRTLVDARLGAEQLRRQSRIIA